jgi:hypothetical protein
VRHGRARHGMRKKRAARRLRRLAHRGRFHHCGSLLLILKRVYSGSSRFQEEVPLNRTRPKCRTYHQCVVDVSTFCKTNFSFDTFKQQPIRRQNFQTVTGMHENNHDLSEIERIEQAWPPTETSTLYADGNTYMLLTMCVSIKKRQFW